MIEILIEIMEIVIIMGFLFISIKIDERKYKNKR